MYNVGSAVKRDGVDGLARRGWQKKMDIVRRAGKV